MQVKVWALQGGEDTMIGTLSWDGEKIVPSSGAKILSQILNGELRRAGKRYTSADGPAFLAELHKHYTGAYLRVGKVTDASPDVRVH